MKEFKPFQLDFELKTEGFEPFLIQVLRTGENLLLIERRCFPNWIFVRGDRQTYLNNQGKRH